MPPRTCHTRAACCVRPHAAMHMHMHLRTPPCRLRKRACHFAACPGGTARVHACTLVIWHTSSSCGVPAHICCGATEAQAARHKHTCLPACFMRNARLPLASPATAGRRECAYQQACLFRAAASCCCLGVGWLVGGAASSLDRVCGGAASAPLVWTVHVVYGHGWAVTGLRPAAACAAMRLAFAARCGGVAAGGSSERTIAAPACHACMHACTLL